MNDESSTAPRPPVPPAEALPVEPSVAGEEDPGSFEDDPAMREALRDEAAAVRSRAEAGDKPG